MREIVAVCLTRAKQAVEVKFSCIEIACRDNTEGRPRPCWCRNMTINAVELEGVTKSFGRTTAVAELSLAVPKGSIYGFIGPNGAGKTTTLRMITGIFYPDQGIVRVLGNEVRGACSNRIGYLPEERGLYRRMKLREILCFFGELKGGRNMRAEVDYWLLKLGLAECANRKIEALSKGMSQKAQFIATVIAKPELLILDEPFSGLDPINMEVIRDAVLELRSQGATVILSTHDMSIAEKMCDFIFMIFRGRKVLDGTLDSIQRQYGNDTIRVRTECGVTGLRDLDGVDSVRDFGQMQELRLHRETDPQGVVSAIMGRTRVWSFEVAKPSLHDIFVRIAGSDGKEAENA
jgi:ABC-2 type transport system ATP-binding protein